MLKRTPSTLARDNDIPHEFIEFILDRTSERAEETKGETS
jgi:hypothetical protein